MSSMRVALQRVKRQLRMMKLFVVVMNSLLIFLACASVFTLVNVSWWYALIPAGIYVLPTSMKRLRDVRLKEAEERIPDLEWQLRTAEDTLGKENEVVESLHHRVLQKIAHLKNSYLIDSKTVRYRVTGVILLGMMFAALTLFQITLGDMIGPEGITGLFTQIDDAGRGLLDAANGTFLASKKGERDIYGEEDLAKLGDEELDLKLNREKSEIDRDSLGDLTGRQFAQQGVLGDIGANSDASYQEDIADKHKKVVKNYFEQLAGET